MCPGNFIFEMPFKKIDSSIPQMGRNINNKDCFFRNSNQQ